MLDIASKRGMIATAAPPMMAIIDVTLLRHHGTEAVRVARENG